MKANAKIGDSEMFLVKAKITASIKQQLYIVYVHLVQQIGTATYARSNCKSGKGGCCMHVAVKLYVRI